MNISKKTIQGKKIPSFDFIHINAMSLTNPNLVYTILAEKIIDKKMNPATASLFLDEFLKAKAHEKPRIVEKQRGLQCCPGSIRRFHCRILHLGGGGYQNTSQETAAGAWHI